MSTEGNQTECWQIFIQGITKKCGHPNRPQVCCYNKCGYSADKSNNKTHTQGYKMDNNSVTPLVVILKTS